MSAPSLIGKFTPEEIEDAIALINTTVKRPDYGLSSYGWAPLPESYLRKHVRLHIHLIHEVGVNCPDFCAVYEPHPELYSRLATVMRKGRDAESARLKYCDLDVPMLVGVVKTTKRHLPTPIPSVVQLQLLDDCDVPGFQPRRPFLKPEGPPLPGANRPNVAGISPHAENLAACFVIGLGYDNTVDFWQRGSSCEEICPPLHVKRVEVLFSPVNLGPRSVG